MCNIYSIFFENFTYFISFTIFPNTYIDIYALIPQQQTYCSILAMIISEQIGVLALYVIGILLSQKIKNIHKNIGKNLYFHGLFYILSIYCDVILCFYALILGFLTKNFSKYTIIFAILAIRCTMLSC